MTDATAPSRNLTALGSVPPRWNFETDGPLICCAVRDETHDVKSFLFRTKEPRSFRFAPGQFITLELVINGEAINRCYTLSSAPTRPDTISITVKRKPGGVVSNWLHDNLKPGSEINVLGAAGEFSFTGHSAPKYLFLSGGSGVTPLMSMTRTLYDLGEGADVVFAHSARTSKDIIFERELAAMAHVMPSLRTAFVCESASEAAPWQGHTGLLDLHMLRAIARDYMHREVFCCGPEPYMAAVRTLLQGAGFNMRHYHEESFSFERVGAAEEKSTVPETSAQSTAGAFKVEFTKSGQTVSCGPEQFILDAARAAGMRLPFSCAKGMCGTCKTKKLSGDVVMSHQGGIRQREIDQGMILPCCSKPTSDVALER